MVHMRGSCVWVVCDSGAVHLMSYLYQGRLKRTVQRSEFTLLGNLGKDGRRHLEHLPFYLFLLLLCLGKRIILNLNKDGLV